MFALNAKINDILASTRPAVNDTRLPVELSTANLYKTTINELIRTHSFPSTSYHLIYFSSFQPISLLRTIASRPLAVASSLSPTARLIFRDSGPNGRLSTEVEMTNSIQTGTLALINTEVSVSNHLHG